MKKISIWAFSLLIGTTAFAWHQDLHFADETKLSQQTFSKLSLKEGLSKITRLYGTRFVYESNLVEDVQVIYDWEKIASRSAVEVLDAILPSHGLSYQKVNDNYFIIKRASAKPKASAIHITHNEPASVTEQARFVAITDTVVLPRLQNQNQGVLRGRVTEKLSGKPLVAATLSLPQFGLFTITDERGDFVFNAVPAGTVRVTIQHISTVPYEGDFQVQQGKETVAAIRVDANTLSLIEIKVVAEEGRGVGGTSSRISKTAIEHIQATSLGDVMQLLPGAVVTNPTFSGVNKISLRQANADNIGSLGTSVIINGAPVSNNANLQVANAATSGANAAFATSAGAGLDMRQFSADNIESVEVIRGIPSVEYGDLTSGAVIVKTKAGKEPLNIKARVNPRLVQLWGGKGFDLGKDQGSLYLDADYTSAVDDQRYVFRGYDRVSANALYSRKFFKSKPLFTTTGLGYSTNIDNERQDPDDTRSMARRKADEYSIRFNTSGRLSLAKKFARTIHYDVGVTYSEQNGFSQELLSGYIYPLSTAMKDTMMKGEYVPSEYLAQYNIQGKPLNVFAKLTNQFFLNTGIWRHRFLMGAEWRTDANFGEGKTYNLSRPPRMLGGNASRPISYKDIPALNQFSLYLEDAVFARVLDRRVSLQAGARFDNVQPSGPFSSKMDMVVSPRLNLSVELFENFNLRAGYGVTAKAPTLLYLYPQAAYYDLLNFNYYPTNPDERLVLVTTKVFDLKNPDLKMMTNLKKEIGFDWTIKKKRLTVTAFHERTKNGYDFSTIFNSVAMVPLPKYSIMSQTPGMPPTLDPVPASIDTFIADYNMPNNNRLNINKGVEFDLDLGRFDAIRTSFVLTGAWINSKSVQDEYYIEKRQVAGKDPSRVAVYAAGRGDEDERITTTLRMIHNIPELRFVVTFSAQTIWDQSNIKLGRDSIPVGYIRRDNSELVWMTDAQKQNITSADQELFMNVTPQTYIKESWPPLWLFNLRLTKVISKNIGFSFYANNVFSHRPLVASTRYKNEFQRRNPVLFFGTELNIKL